MNRTRNDTRSARMTSVFEESNVSKAFKTTAYSIILLTSLVGNCLLILAIKRNINGRMRTVSNLLIASVALSDLIMTVWSFPERMTRILTNDSWLVPGVMGSILCKIVNFVEKVSITVSVTHLGALSVERFLAVFSPYKTVIKLPYVKFITGALWIGSVVYWSPILHFGNIIVTKRGLKCEVRSFISSWRQWYLAFIIILCAVMIVILVLYTAIAVNLCRRKDPRMRLVTQRKKSDHIKRRVVVMVGVIIITFYACFLPYWIGWVSCSYAPNMPERICNRTYKFISILFSYMSCMTNPIVCFLFIGYFRFAFKAIILDPLNRKSNELRLRLRRKSSLTEIDSVVPLQVRKNGENHGIKHEEEETDNSNHNDQLLQQNNINSGSTSIIIQQPPDECSSLDSEPPSRREDESYEENNPKDAPNKTEQLEVENTKTSHNRNTAICIPTVYGTPL
ncbi:substance-K receptor-like [Actinia tenebrosa]|uniref:Substance-K receptor-like n=1 Tax=Actinia tenebrosa TaxID=6105 RepID=A0A6P8J2N6_ACTTE|nr:substance-K receptor-like [Actinia tenebrosa]